MKALYRFLLMLLLALPALNVLAASADMAMAGAAITSADCMAHASCHDKTAGKMPEHAGHAKAAHGMLCGGAGCVQLCAPALSQLANWSAAPLATGGIFVPTQPATLAGITLSPPHRPPVLA